MADAHSGQERTEQATAKRLSEAREKGQIPRSRELTTMLLLLTTAATLWSTYGTLSTGLRQIMVAGLTLTRARIVDEHAMTTELMAAGGAALQAAGPLFIVTVLAFAFGSLALGGIAFAPAAIGFQWSRLDPIQGLARLLSLHSLVEVGKALLKFVLLLGCGLGALALEFDKVRALANASVEASLAQGLWLSFLAFVLVSAGTVLIAFVDVPFQWWDHRRKLMMTRQDLRDESKESDGNPEVKQRVRAMQYELASRRMMEEVPKADVIITNPTHFAVALRFDATKMAAPKVVAKGSDHIAFRIRELARQSGVPVLEAPPLARAIFHSTKLNREIPAGLYVAVAQVLAYVFQLRQRPPGAPTPVEPRDFTIPSELQL